MGGAMRDLTLVLPHFCNLGMLSEQEKIWAAYPSDLRSRLHVVVVDDRSPKGFRPTPKMPITVDGLASFRIYRLIEKKRWNWLACRNLGAKLATTDWILLTDIDHALPVETLRRLLDGDLNPKSAYRFSRVDAPRPWPYGLSECSAYKPHNDTWLMTKSLFFSDGVFGYDERLSGCYGTSGEFKDRVYATADSVVRLPEVVIRYPREIIPDASTHPSVYTRKGDPGNDRELENRKRKRAQIRDWKPLHGLTPYEEVYNSAMVPVC
jgi:hypothetical protein